MRVSDRAEHEKGARDMGKVRLESQSGDKWPPRSEQWAESCSLFCPLCDADADSSNALKRSQAKDEHVPPIMPPSHYRPSRVRPRWRSGGAGYWEGRRDAERMPTCEAAADVWW
jgi:hypothetical protein